MNPENQFHGRIVTKIPYGFNPLYFYTAVYFLTLIALIFGTISFREKSWIGYAISALCILAIAKLFNIKNKKLELVIYEDGIFIPFLSKGYESFKNIAVQDIEKVVLNTRDIISMTIFRKNNLKPVVLAQTVLEESDFYLLYEHLNQIANFKEEIDQKTVNIFNKKTFLTLLAIAALPFLIILIPLIKNPANTSKQLPLLLAILILPILGGFVQIFAVLNFKQDYLKNISILKDKLTSKKRMLASLSATILIFSYLFGGILIFRFADKPTDDSLVFYFSISFALIICLSYYFLFKDNLRYVFRTEKVTFFSCFILFGLCFFYPVTVIINYKFDKNLSYVKAVPLISSEKFNDCFQPLDWNLTGPIEKTYFCKTQYPNLKSTDKVNLTLGRGYLSIPWLIKIEHEKYASANAFIKSLNTPSDLKYDDIKSLIELKGKNFWDEISKSWLIECENSNWSSCRHLGNLSAVKGERLSAIGYFQKGCTNNDFFNCYNLFAIKEAHSEELFQKLDKFCNNSVEFDKQCKAYFEAKKTMIR